MLFKNVIGQSNLKRQLINSVKEGRISHAQIFSGPEGVGKLALALAYAQYISCINKQSDDSCGVCHSCHKYQKLIHPDLHFVFPVFPTKKINKPESDDFLPQWRKMVISNPYFTLSQWLGFIENENAQGMIYDRESNAIIKKLSFKSFESEYKVMIIWLPEKMHNNCANKLLKLIEEPPEKTLFILISENEDAIIPTIRSRSQLIRIPAIDQGSLKAALENDNQLSSEKISEAVRLSEGNYITALDHLNSNENTKLFFTYFQEMMRLAYAQQISKLLQLTEEITSMGRDRQKAFLNFALRLTREYFMMNLKEPEIIYLNNTELKWGKQFAPFINETNIIPISKTFEDAIDHITMNGNSRIVFFDTTLQIVKLIRRERGKRA